MKEASGELNLTVITIIAVVAVGAIFAIFLWPLVQRQIADNACKTYGAGWSAEKDTNAAGTAIGGNVTANKWKCCPPNGGTCITMD